MRKEEFLEKLRLALSGLPHQELKEHLDFYQEMIDDRMEEGCTEEEAVLAIGSVDEIATQIISDTPLTKLAKERIKPPRRIRAWEIVLLVLGSPIWLSLAIATFAVVLSLYAVLWSLIASLWAVFASLVACAVGVTAAGIAVAIYARAPFGIAMVGIGLLCAGLAIFLFFGCTAATKGTVRLTQVIALGIKKRLIKKEDSQ